MATLLSSVATSPPNRSFDPLPPLLVRMMEGVESGLTSANSRRAYRNALLHFIKWCSQDPDTRQMTRISVLEYKDALLNPSADAIGARRHYAAATVNLRLAAVKALAQECADAGLIGQSEAAAISRVRGTKLVGERLGNWLSKEQVDLALRSIDRRGLRGKRNYAMLAVLFSTGLRRHELIGLETATMRELDGQWGFLGLQGKGGKARNISLPTWVRSAILDWMDAAGIVHGAIFRSISQHGSIGSGPMSGEAVKYILMQCMSVIGCDHIRPHDARRTCAQLCRAGGARLEDVQELLGHSSIQTTERYLGKNEGFKRAITNLIREPEVVV